MADFSKVQKKFNMTDLVKAAPLPLLGILGGLASCTAEIVTFPLDNIKTRMQMNGKQGLPVYLGLFDCAKKTLKSQGIQGFYRGISASMLRQLPYSTVRIGTYEAIKRYFTADVEEVVLPRKLLAGGLAGAVGCIFGTPGDVLKVRMINDLTKTQYKSCITTYKQLGLIDCARQTIEAGGINGFLKGLEVNICRAVIVNACELATYDTFKIIAVKNLNMDQDKLPTHFVASTGAGFIAAVVSSPVDVVKTRYMNQLKSETMYTSATRCAMDIFKTEGVGAFYKGFGPYFFRITPWTILMFVSFEKYKQLVLPRLYQ